MLLTNAVCPSGRKAPEGSRGADSRGNQGVGGPPASSGTHPRSPGSGDWFRQSELFGLKRRHIDLQRGHKGRRPYWGVSILRKYIRPVAASLDIQKRIRLAYLSAHLFHASQKCRGRIQSDAGTSGTFGSTDGLSRAPMVGANTTGSLSGRLADSPTRWQ